MVACPPRRCPPASRFSSGSARAAAPPPARAILGVVVGDRRFVGGGADVAREQARARVVEDRRLDPPAEQLVRLAHEELVEAVLARDEHGETAAAPARAPPLLAQRGDGPGKADRDDDVEQADVDAELQRVRGGDAEQLAVDQAALDLSALCGRVAGAIGREMRVVAEPLGGEAVDELGRLPALCKGERPQASLDEERLQLRRFRERARRVGRARRRAAAGSRARPCARRAARRRRRSRSPRSPRSAAPSSPGFEMVAEASRNCGSAP